MPGKISRRAAKSQEDSWDHGGETDEGLFPYRMLL
jgi:hypothetical protein